MKKLIKILSNIFYIASLSFLVFLGSIISKVTDKGGHNEKKGQTVSGSNLESFNVAFADVPTTGGGAEGSDGDGCEGGGGGSC